MCFGKDTQSNGSLDLFDKIKVIRAKVRENAEKSSAKRHED